MDPDQATLDARDWQIEQDAEELDLEAIQEERTDRQINQFLDNDR